MAPPSTQKQPHHSPNQNPNAQDAGPITYDSRFHSSRALQAGTAKWYDFLKPVEEPLPATNFFEPYLVRVNLRRTGERDRGGEE